MDEKRKSFAQLVKEKATCSEFAWHGYIRLYEKDEKCDCLSCVNHRRIFQGENDENRSKTS